MDTSDYAEWTEPNVADCWMHSYDGDLYHTNFNEDAESEYQSAVSQCFLPVELWIAKCKMIPLCYGIWQDTLDEFRECTNSASFLAAELLNDLEGANWDVSYEGDTFAGVKVDDELIEDCKSVTTAKEAADALYRFCERHEFYPHDRAFQCVTDIQYHRACDVALDFHTAGKRRYYNFEFEETRYCHTLYLDDDYGIAESYSAYAFQGDMQLWP